MLQRIQTLWLLAASACALLSLKYPFFTGTRLQVSTVSGDTSLKIYQSLTAASNILVLILTIAVLAAGLVNIFNYKNRTLQLRITLLLISVGLLNIVLLIRESRQYDGHFALTALLALAVPVFFLLAARGIYRDQQLVKNADRLR